MAPLSRASRPSVVTVPPSAEGLPLLDFLLQRFPAISAATWGQRLAAGKVTSGEGTRLDAAHPCRAGERYFYFREVEAEPRVNGEVEILVETAHFLIVDKPPGLPVHATGPFVCETLLARLERDLELTDLSAAHRLDLETSGLVLVVKSRENRGIYQQLFARGEVRKEYLALAQVPAEPTLRRWRVENRLERGQPFFRMRVVPGEVNAKTEIELLAWEQGIGRFRLGPETGKKHQLRVHMAGLGFPILGDRYYPEIGGRGGPPLLLLAWRLVFRDPLTGLLFDESSRRQLTI